MNDQVKAVTIPERVAFVNLKDGSVFFDCHPAEARAAMDAVKAVRMGTCEEKEIKEIRKTIDEVLKIAKTKTAQTVEVRGELKAKDISDCFKSVEVLNTRVTHILLNAYEYADLRKWERDNLDIETNIVYLKEGVMAKMFGAYIIVTKLCPRGRMIFSAHGEEKEAVITFDVVRKPVVVNFEAIMRAIDEFRSELSAAMGRGTVDL